jgi:hypothetical protein
MSTSVGLTKAAYYEIRVKGELDLRWQAWFEGMTITIGDDETLISGTVSDQAALHSMLTRIRDLGLPLIAVRHIQSNFAREESSRPRSDPC